MFVAAARFTCNQIRRTPFQVDLVRRLSAAGVEYEELVIPDDTHHWMRHANSLKAGMATAEYFDRKLNGGAVTSRVVP